MTKKNSKIGLALGAGGARGLAHIGVLQALEDTGLDIDFIAGTSMGSLVGGLYACGLPLLYLKRIAEALDWDTITDITIPRRGLIKGKKLLAMLELLTRHKKISELNLPFAAVCCDIERGERVIIKNDSLARAIRASTSIPGIFIPFRHQNKLLVDGGVMGRIPAHTVKSMGADIVIAVDVGARELKPDVTSIFDVLYNTFDIMQRRYEKIHKLEADIVIKPDLTGVTSFDLDKVNQCVTAGYRAAEKRFEELTERIEEISE